MLIGSSRKYAPSFWDIHRYWLAMQLEGVEWAAGCPAALRCRRCGQADAALVRARGCGHGFCGRCVGMVRAPRFQCPVDSRSVDKKELVLDEEVKDKILDLAVFCLQKKRGCKRTLILRDLESHLESCGFVAVCCPCGCGLQVPKRELARHLAEECKRRLIPCQHCAEDVVFEHMKDHDSQCGKGPVTCLHCKSEIRREQMPSHELSCPMKPRVCPLYDAGCPFKGTSEELERHSSDTHSHVQVIAETMTHYRLTIQNLQEKLDEYSTENMKLKEQMEDIYPVLGTVKIMNKSLTELKEKVKRLEISEQTMEEMNETLARLKDYMQGVQPAVVQDHKSKSPQGTKSPERLSPPRGPFNTSFEDGRPRHAAPPTDL